MPSSEASITTAQSVPTHLIQSNKTHAMQKNRNQVEITAFTPEKGYVFFFVILLTKKNECLMLLMDPFVLRDASSIITFLCSRYFIS